MIKRMKKIKRINIALCLGYNDAAPQSTAISSTFKHMKVNTLSYNGATVAHGLF